MQLVGDSRGLVEVIFDFDDELVHRAVFTGGHTIFDDLGKAVQDLLDRGGVDVHAADDQHVVGAAENAAFEEDEAVRAVAGQIGRTRSPVR